MQRVDTGGDGVSWEVDDRRITLTSRGYVAFMWLARDKTAFEGAAHTRATALERQAKGDAPPTRWTRLTTRVDMRRVGGHLVWRLAPRRRPGRAPVRVVYVHGGGYVHPLTKDYWRLVRRLVRAGAEVVVPAYPLAPGTTVDEGLGWLVRVEAETRTSAPTVLMGDSAGGALVLEIAMRLRDTGQPTAARVVALCPWLDATLQEPSVAGLEASDPMLAESGLRAAGRWWAGRRTPADPMVSPLVADLEGLPPVDVFIGDRDILRPAVEVLVERARATSGQVTVCVHEVTAMFHVWMTRPLVEARRTRRRLADVVAEVVAAECAS